MATNWEPIRAAKFSPDWLVMQLGDNEWVMAGRGLSATIRVYREHGRYAYHVHHRTGQIKVFRRLDHAVEDCEF